MVYFLIATHIAAVVAGGYLHYRYGAKVYADVEALRKKL